MFVCNFVSNIIIFFFYVTEYKKFHKFFSFRAEQYLACLVKMREKVSCGWIQGKNGFWRVDPNWKNPEGTLPGRSKVEMMNIGPMGEKEIGKLKEGAEVKGEMAVSVTPKKKNPGLLGPKGLKRTAWRTTYGSTPANNYGGLVDKNVEGLAAFFLEEKKMKREGYGIFPEGFNPSSFDSRKTLTFVRPDQHTSVTCEYYKLANINKEGPKYFCLNPFIQAAPFGQSQPLPK